MPDASDKRRRSFFPQFRSANDRRCSHSTPRGVRIHAMGSTFLRRASAFLQRGSAFLRRGSTFLRRASAFLQRGSAFLRRGSTFLRRGSAFLQRGSAFLRRASAFLQRGSSFLQRGSSFLRRASAFLRRASPNSQRPSPNRLSDPSDNADARPVHLQSPRNQWLMCPKPPHPRRDHNSAFINLPLAISFCKHGRASVCDRFHMALAVAIRSIRVLQLNDLPVRLRPPIPEELPRTPYFLDHVQIELRDE